MWKTLLRWCAVPLVSLWAAPSVWGQCQVPHYRIGKVLDYTVTAPTLIADISIRPDEFTLEKLICLATALKQKFPAPEVAVGIFSSHSAAVNFTAPSIEKRPNDDLWASHMHGEYYYNAERGEEYVSLIPDGLNPAFNTRVTLPATGKLSCRLQIQDRCLVAFNHIYLLAGMGSGAVTLAAQIQPDGSVSGVRIVDPDAVKSKDEHEIADYAVQHLQSWHFEQRKTNVSIKITYSVEHVDTPLTGGMDVQFMLPDRVDIKLGPLLVTRPK